MHKTEMYYHTDRQVSSYVEQAYDVLNERDVPDEHRAGLVPVLVSLIAQKHIAVEQPAPLPDLSAIRLGH